MKKKNREINIFNLSMLDVICGAMGAFLAIMIVLLPYYKKTHIDYREMLRELEQQMQQLQEQMQTLQQQMEAERERNRQLARQNEQLQEELQQERERSAQMAQELAKSFLVIHISWETSDDVDLHVVDPNGRKFYFGQKSFPNYPGELSVDSTRGAGNEVWISREAVPGEYRIMAHLFSRRSNNPPVVTGKAVSRNGDTPLREITLTGARDPELMATVVVDGSGNVTVR